MTEQFNTAVIKANEIESLRVSLRTLDRPAMHLLVSTFSSKEIDNKRCMEYGYWFAPTHILKFIKFFNENYRFDDIDQYKFDLEKHEKRIFIPNTWILMFDYNNWIYMKTNTDIKLNIYKEGEFMRICAEKENILAGGYTDTYQMLDLQLPEYYVRYIYKQLKDKHYL